MIAGVSELDASGHYSGIRTRDPGEFMAQLAALRMGKLRAQIAYCFSRSSFYRAKFIAAGVRAPEDVRTMDEFRRLPALITKAEHRAIQEESLERHGHPYGTHLCAELDKVIHVAGTSGTTGDPTFYTFTRKDLAIASRVFGRVWRAAGLRPGDTVFHANGLSLWLGGVTALMTLEDFGARPIPVGAEAGVSRILRYIRLTRPLALLCTPSLASHLVERAPQELGCEVASLGIRKLLIGGEPGGGLPETRARLMNAYGAKVHDLTGGAWHNGTLSSGERDYHGMHSLGDDYCFRWDLRDPVTKEPLELVDGAVGEALHTALEYEAGPAMRYATGDILRLHIGECPDDGIFGVRIEIIGRVDDLLIVKGVKVYPASIKGVVEGFVPDLSGRMRIELDQPPPLVVPPLRLTVEAGAALADSGEQRALAARLADRMHQVLSVRPEVCVVPFGSMERSLHKSKIVHVRGTDE